MWGVDWLIGDGARLSTAIADAAGAAADPAVLRLKTKAPSGAVTTYTYGAGADIVRDALGAYHADIALNQAGQWVWRWESDTPNAGAVEGELFVKASRL